MRVARDSRLGPYAIVDDSGEILRGGYLTEQAARAGMLAEFDHDHDCKPEDFDYDCVGDPPEYVGGCDTCARQRREERARA